MTVVQTPNLAVMQRSASAPGRRRVRVMKLVAGFGSGGTERQFTNLALGLDTARFDVQFGCLRYWGQLIEELEAQQIPVAEYPITSFYRPSALFQQARFARDVRRQGVDIVHTYNFYANVFGVPVARMAGVPLVLASIRDMGVYLNATQRRVQRLACRMADRILVNADAVRRWLIAEGYEADKIDVITNGIDLRQFAIAPEPGRVRKELGLDTHTPIVLLVSRLVPRKGIEDFLDAAARVAPHAPDVRFLVVGEHAIPPDGSPPRNYRAELESYAQRVGIGRQVLFTGLRRDIPALMAEASVSVLPSLSEGLSNVLLESMAMGAPVVATRVGGVPEAVQDGVTGLLVPPGNADELARAIRHLLDHPDTARRLGAAGKQLIAERFSLSRMVTDTERHYTTLLGRARRRPVVHT